MAEQDIWTKEEVEKVDNHMNEEEEKGDEGTGRTEGGSADEKEEGSEKGDEGEGDGEEDHQGGDEGIEHEEHEEQEGDGDSEVFGLNSS